ncbi:uncharacterized protein LOC134226468 [Armigeres subalbatus]|uniref:uncharacterized protein LOC134226468 n=1 Tax=Armigeres subalbatus TaxID=124917 RepID=UPI002ED5449D
MNTTLSREQIATRQAVPCDLPKFNGNPEDWPMFISTVTRIHNCFRRPSWKEKEAWPSLFDSDDEESSTIQELTRQVQIHLPPALPFLAAVTLIRQIVLLLPYPSGAAVPSFLLLL